MPTPNKPTAPTIAGLKAQVEEAISEKKKEIAKKFRDPKQKLKGRLERHKVTKAATDKHYAEETGKHPPDSAKAKALLAEQEALNAEHADTEATLQSELLALEAEKDSLESELKMPTDLAD